MDRGLLRERLHEMFPPNWPLHGASLLEVRDTADSVVLMVRWNRDPHLYGIPIDLDDTSHEFYYDDCPVGSAEEWLDSVQLGLMVSMDTGLRANARRTAIADYIELRREGGWPEDRRFVCDVVRPKDTFAWVREPFVRESGLDTSLARATRETGRLVAWITAYENNATGSPYVGQAVVSWVSKGIASLDHVEVLPEAPLTLTVDMAHLAAQAAAWSGMTAVTTAIAAGELEIAGFRYASDGTRGVDTSFLDVDPDAATRLLAESLAEHSRWGQDRDAASRYLPLSRWGRWRHRLRHGPSGARPRRFVG